ncbi:hypothetical protein SDC9_130632 [bioreactor metagenome]|uniref:Uncharacterized protein n=1 Tax=bioreactor metagenome TaxID=1076179 RepID=A0A645D3C5_9ZZZZ
MHRRAAGLQHLDRLRCQLIIATDHDRQGACLGAGLATAHRGVHHLQQVFGRHRDTARQLADIAGGDGGAHHEHGRRLNAGQQAIRTIKQRRQLGEILQHVDDHVAGLADDARCRLEDRPLGCQRRGRGFAPRPYRQLVTGGDQLMPHRGAHLARAQQGDT